MRPVRALGRSILILSLALTALVGAAAPASADETLTQAERVIATAVEQKGDRWAFAATGPNQFDCSGLVTFAFKQHGLIDLIGGKRRTVAGYYKYFKALGQADLVEGLPGDLIVWGNDKHIGIYLGGGMAVSALVNPHGVKVHPISKSYLGMRIKAFLHVALER